MLLLSALEVRLLGRRLGSVLYAVCKRHYLLLYLWLLFSPERIRVRNVNDAELVVSLTVLLIIRLSLVLKSAAPSAELLFDIVS